MLLYPSIVFIFIFDQHTHYHFEEIFEQKSSSTQKDVFKFFSIQNCRTLQIKNWCVRVSFAIPNTLRRRTERRRRPARAASALDIQGITLRHIFRSFGTTVNFRVCTIHLGKSVYIAKASSVKALRMRCAGKVFY